MTDPNSLCIPRKFRPSWLPPVPALACATLLAVLAPGCGPQEASGSAPEAASAEEVSTQPLAATPLRWAPPVLTNPITLTLGTGRTSNTLDPAKDYIIKLPRSKKVGSTTFVGGRNIVIIGGHITIPVTSELGAARRALYIKDATGTVHIEGVLVDGSGGEESDALAISAPNAIVQVQNFRVSGLRGSNDGWHADIIQPWGGVKELRVDRLTGSSHYQGLQVPIDSAPIGRATLQNVNLVALEPLSSTAMGGYMLWLAHNCNDYPVSLANVYVQPRAGRTLGKSVWPDQGDPACPAVISNNEASWPGLTITGKVIGGAPAGGDFVPSGVAGVNYVSPGYQ